MIRFGEYLCVESKDEISSSDIRNGDATIAGGVIYNVNTLSFPCFFVRSESYDRHFCDTWIPSECFEDMYNDIGIVIANLERTQRIIKRIHEKR